MKRYIVAAGLGLLLAGQAHAHVVLAEREAPAGSYFKLVLRVPHGCDGAPTTGLRVAIPPGIATAKPMAKPGWTAQVTREPLTQPVVNEGRKLTKRVAAVSWRGGPLPDDQFDEFAILLRLPDRAGPLSFPVVQTCGVRTVQWTDPAQAGGGHHAGHPAPVLTVTPKAGG